MSKIAWFRFTVTISSIVLLLGGLTLLVFNRVEWLRRISSFTEPFVLPKGSVPMRLSSETSFVTEPLKEDGKSLDFFAALEEHYTPKFEPGENGFRDIVQFFGRSLHREISYDQWTELCDKLSLDPSGPPRLEYLRLVDHLSMKLAEIRGPGVTMSDVWDVYFRYGKPDEQTPEDMEMLGSWLEHMAPAFDVVEKALEKPVYFIPPGRFDDRSDLRSGAAVQRSLQEYFRLRVIYRLSVDDAAEAWYDVLVMYRLARLYSRQPFFYATDIAVALDASASAMAQDVIQTGLLDDEQLRQAMLDLDRLPAAGVFEDQLDTERLGLLQCIAELPDKGLASFRIGLIDEAFPSHASVEVHNKTARDINQTFRALPFDWNIVAETVNTGFDDLLGKKKGLVEKAAIPPTKMYEKLKPQGIKERSVELGRHFFAVYGPDRQRWNTVCARRDVAIGLTRSMIALERYKNRHGDYPDRLAGLVDEKLLERIPTDAYRPDKPLIYRRENTGYFLYSVGPNGEDNDGKHWKSSPPDDMNWDDVAVEMP